MIARPKQRGTDGRKRAMPAAQRTCAECAYGLANPNGAPETIACVNHVEAPGQWRPVAAGGTCRNFRVRRRPPVRAEPPAPPDDDVRYIALTKGKFALVDAADYEWLSRYKWTASCKGDKCYAYRKDKGRHVLMHRLIMQAPPGLVVDHIDGNSCNNRRHNLRVCTQAQNCRNARPRVGTSGFKGVRAQNTPGRFVAEITFEGRHDYIGSFTDEIEAAIAYDLRAIVLFAEFARLNFPSIINATRQAKKQKDPTLRACA
ncbi:MAG: HNH endonuclease [Phycisphaerales bacterium]|nr:MAG: HNH endonuclease [Phycisphaerales bacterium]